MSENSWTLVPNPGGARMQMVVTSLVPFPNGLCTQVLMLRCKSTAQVNWWLGTHGESCPTKNRIIQGENQRDGKQC